MNCKEKYPRSLGLKMMACLLVLLVAFGATAELAIAKKKKKKKDEEQVDPEIAKQKYIGLMNRYWSFGWENYKNKQYAGAKKYFWKVVELDSIPEFSQGLRYLPKLHRYLGDAYFKLENVDSAQIVFELGIEMYPDDAHLHRMVGFIQSQREQIPEAIEQYEKAVALEPEKKDDWKRLAALYVRNERVPDAIDAYNKVLELDPNDLEAQENVSVLAISEGDIEGAITTKKTLAEQDPENSRVRYDLGQMLFDLQEYGESIGWFNQYLTLSPDDISAIEYIGNSYRNLEKYNSALAQYKKILALQPQNKKIMCEVSTCYKEMGRFSSARSYANKAITADRSFGLGWIALGEAYEASAEKCVDAKDGKLDFTDKLVYELAFKKFKQAKKDPAYMADAERKISYVKPVVPSADDRFMHKGEKITGECYTWIN